MARRMRSGAGKPQISPLRYPGFPVETRGTDELHAVFFKGKPHTWSLPAARGGKSGSGRDDKGRAVTHFRGEDGDGKICGATVQMAPVSGAKR